MQMMVAAASGQAIIGKLSAGQLKTGHAGAKLRGESSDAGAIDLYNAYNIIRDVRSSFCDVSVRLSLLAKTRALPAIFAL